MRPLVVVGDALLDRDLDGRTERLAPDAPVPVVDDPVARARPGGAALAAALAATAGSEVVLVTALATDEAGAELRALLGEAGVAVVDLGLLGGTPEKVRVMASGRPLVRIDRATTPGAVGPLSDAAARALDDAAAVLVSDYGRGIAARPDVREALTRRRSGTPLVWDPHPRGPEPVPGAHLVTPNAAEATRLVGHADGSGAPAPSSAVARVAPLARALAERWAAGAVAVTMGAEGALVAGTDGSPLVVPAPVVDGGDSCGAGDRFAAAAAVALAAGALPSEAVVDAVAAASAFVAAGGATACGVGSGGPAGGAATHIDLTDGDRPVAPSADDLVARVRAAGGTVVATGGCFDLLHAGHVSLLRAARRLGDCLVVCLNSDGSVRRLKGPDRPLQGQADRAALLGALDCVDAVAVFDEDTPVELLKRLRPDVFAKGADYVAAELPEAAALARWGGQAVVLPYLPGRSTTRLVHQLTGHPTEERTDAR